MGKRKEELPPPTVTHIMADGSVRTNVKGYLKSFDQLPETAQRLISQLMLGPINHDLPKK